MFRTSLPAITLFLLSATASAAETTPEKIAQAIRDLSDRSFQVREKATKFLWEAGEAAELPLQRALQSGDPEVVRRARSILERFDRGEHPDTPKDIVVLLQQHREGNQTTRLTVLEQLVEKGKYGFISLRRLSRNKDYAADRPLILGLLVKHAPRQVPRLVVAGDLQAAQEWLEYCMIAPGYSAHEHYAALVYLRKELPKSLAFWKNEPASASRTLALAHLALVQQDSNQARPLVDETKDISLRDRLNLSTGAWQRVSNVSAALESSMSTPERLCLTLAAYHLEGDAAKYDAMVKRMVGQEKQPTAAARLFAETLVQLGDWPAAEQLLQTNRASDPLLFEILAERKGEKAALDWAQKQKPTSTAARHELDLFVARRLFLLGEKAKAIRLADTYQENWREAAQWPLAVRWIAMLQAVGQTDRAMAHAADMLDALRRSEMDEGVAAIFESIFGADAAFAEAWWYYLRVAQSGESPGKTMELVKQILSGTKLPRLADWARDLIDSWRAAKNEQPDSSVERRERALIGPLAAAEALQRAGLDEQAETSYRAAMEALPAVATIHYADPLLAKRRFNDAAALLDTAWQAAPDQPMLLFLRGRALELAGQKGEGERLKELSHWLPLANLRSRWQFAQDLRRRNFHADAEREVEIALAVGSILDPHYDGFLQLGAAHAERRGDYERAARLATQALALDLLVVNPSPPRFALARQAERLRLISKSDKKNEFLRDFSGAIERAPRADFVAAAMPVAAKSGFAAELVKASEPVLRLLDQRCTDYPDSRWAGNEYAWLAAHLQRDLDTALDRAKKAVAREPRNSAYLDTLAEVHFRRGEREQALTRNNECRELQPQRMYYQRQRERFEKGAADSFPPKE